VIHGENEGFVESRGIATCDEATLPQPLFVCEIKKGGFAGNIGRNNS